MSDGNLKKWGELTPWSLIDDNDTEIIKSNVDLQDKIGLEDLDDNDLADIKSFSSIKKTFKKSKGINNFGNTVTSNATGGVIKPSRDEDAEKKIAQTLNLNRNYDINGVSIEDIKSNKYKKVKLSSKMLATNNYANIIGSTTGMFVGTLGRSFGINLFDSIGKKVIATPDVLNQTGFDLTSLATGAEKLLKGGLSPEDFETMAGMAISNELVILHNKPGRKIYENKEHFLANNSTDGFDSIVLNQFGEYLKKHYNIELTNNVETSEDKWKSKNISRDGIIYNNMDNSMLKMPRAEISIGINNGNTNISINDYDPEFSRIKKAEIYEKVNNTFREIGGLYIEPFWSNGQCKNFEIPFEFNPKITEGGLTAKYQSEQLLGRILPLKSYVNSDSGNITIETTYIATSSYKNQSLDINEKRLFNGIDDYIYYGEDNKKRTDSWFNGWMADWTVEKVRSVERQFRSLVLPYIQGSTFVRPPIVRIKMRGLNRNNYSKLLEEDAPSIGGNLSEKEKEKEKGQGQIDDLVVGDLFKYPNIEGCLNATNDGVIEKRYIVMSVTISPLETINYFYKNGDDGVSPMGRYGFKVNLVLSETTKNFLDRIPNYYNYIKSSKIEGENVEIIDYKNAIMKPPATLDNAELSLKYKLYIHKNADLYDDEKIDEMTRLDILLEGSKDVEELKAIINKYVNFDGSNYTFKNREDISSFEKEYYDWIENKYFKNVSDIVELSIGSKVLFKYGITSGINFPSSGQLSSTEQKIFAYEQLFNEGYPIDLNVRNLNEKYEKIIEAYDSYCNCNKLILFNNDKLEYPETSKVVKNNITYNFLGNKFFNAWNNAWETNLFKAFYEYKDEDEEKRGDK